MILLQHSGRPVVKHVGLSALRNFCVLRLHDFDAGYCWGLGSVTLLYTNYIHTWYILQRLAFSTEAPQPYQTVAAAGEVTTSLSVPRRKAEPS